MKFVGSYLVMYKDFLIYWVDNGTYRVSRLNTSIYSLTGMLGSIGIYNVDSIIKIEVVPRES
jgi:hypothetical protein